MNEGLDESVWISDEPVDIDFSIDPERLSVAMKLNGLATLTDLADASGVSDSTLRNIMKGRSSGSHRTLDQLSSAFRLPATFLTTKGVPKVAAVSFRSRNRKLIIEHERFAGFAAALGIFAAFLLGSRAGTMRSEPPVPLLPFPPDGAPEANARLLREHLGISDETPIADTIALAESLGVLVAFGPSEIKVIDSFCAWIGTRHSIVLNSAHEHVLRRRLDTVHEIGHLLMHPQPERYSTARLEDQAFRFATALLFPPTGKNMTRLHNAILDNSTEPLLNIQEEWGISAHALLQVARRYLQKKALIDARITKEAELDSDPERYFRTRWGANGSESPRILADAAEALELRFERSIASLARA